MSKFTHTQRQVDQNHTGNGEPEAEVVQEWECNVASTDLQRYNDVHQTYHERHRHEEDHDYAVSGEDLIVVVRWEESGFTGGRKRLLATHHDGIGKAAQQHDKRHDDIHDTQTFMVNRG